VDLNNKGFCNHQHSNFYALNDQSYANSQGCQPIAYKCDSYDNYNRGLCADCGTATEKHCVPMELNLDYWDDKSNWITNQGINHFYINTGSATTDGYCLNTYQVVVVTDDPTCSGQMQLELSEGYNIAMTLSSANEIKTPITG
ncbi:unnamed protein product, partial [Medioppia subpectinata]